jgi:AhpD family alkylhydroperoxidase
MALLNMVDPNEATDEVRVLYEGFSRAVGRLPDMVRLMAHSPAILDAYLHFNRALERTTLSARTRAVVAVAIAELVGCDYVLSAAIRIGRRHGVTDVELEAARHGLADDAKTADVLALATSIVRSAGRVPRLEIERFQRRGLSDEEIVDVIGVVGLNLFRSYFNLVLDTDVDSMADRTREPIAVAGTSG